MKNYLFINEAISNENVLNVLNQAKLPGEGSLLVEVIERSLDMDVFKVYVPPKDYGPRSSSLTFLATVTKEKEGERIKQWYIKLEGNWKVDS